MNFLIFIQIPFPIEFVMPEREYIWIHLVISFTVETLKGVETEFPFLCL